MVVREARASFFWPCYLLTLPLQYTNFNLMYYEEGSTTPLNPIFPAHVLRLIRLRANQDMLY